MARGGIDGGRTGPQMGLEERTRPGCRRWHPDHCIGRHQSPVRGGIFVEPNAKNFPTPSGPASSGLATQSSLPPIFASAPKEGRCRP